MESCFSITRIPKFRTAVLCSCHFTGSNENPNPYHEAKPKQLPRDDSNQHYQEQPKIKKEVKKENDEYLDQNDSVVGNQTERFSNARPRLQVRETDKSSTKDVR